MPAAETAPTSLPADQILSLNAIVADGLFRLENFPKLGREAGFTVNTLIHSLEALSAGGEDISKHQRKISPELMTAVLTRLVVDSLDSMQTETVRLETLLAEIPDQVTTFNPEGTARTSVRYQREVDSLKTDEVREVGRNLELAAVYGINVSSFLTGYFDLKARYESVSEGKSVTDSGSYSSSFRPLCEIAFRDLKLARLTSGASLPKPPTE